MNAFNFWCFINSKKLLKLKLDQITAKSFYVIGNYDKI